MNNDQVQEIKDRLDIVEIIGQYITLKPSGNNHTALCPFHNEKTPSFLVSSDKQIFKCFGCGDGGDIFTFVEKMEGLTFPEALELLADRAGITLTKQGDNKQYQQQKNEKAVLYKLNAGVAKLFHHLLVNHTVGQPARLYLKQRGVSDTSITRFQVGYAPKKSIIKSWLAKFGFTAQHLADAGNPDRFFDRIMFPLRDPLGNVVGFTGRELGANRGPKYLNTPETKIFHKGRILYGLYEGKQDIKKQKTAMIVEGQLDVILAHQAGAPWTVASSGTALTTDHLKALARYTSKIVLCFDQDSAGIATTKKAIHMSLDVGLDTAVLQLPVPYKDAAELIVKDQNKWLDIVKQSKTAIDWVITHHLNLIGDLTGAQPKKMFATEVLPFVARIEDPLERAHYIAQLAQILAVPEKALTDAIDRIRLPKFQGVVESSKEKTAIALHDQVLGLVMLYPILYQEILEESAIILTSPLAQKIDKLFRSWYSKGQLASNFDSIGKSKEVLDSSEQTTLDLLILEIEQLFKNDDPKSILHELLERIRKQSREKIKVAIATQIAQAEQAGNRAKVKTLIKDLQNMLK